MERSLSYSEIETALTCFARWDFAYGGRLAGTTLKPKEVAPILSDGRAWGAAVAAWHANSDSVLATWWAYEAMRASLDADAVVMAQSGMGPSLNERALAEERLGAMLGHYIETADPLPNLTRLERRSLVGIPSRGLSGRASSRYKFLCLLDGYTTIGNQQWIVEFKLRNALSPVDLIERQRQIRWYAWALFRQQGYAPTGVIVDERLNQAPLAPRQVKGRFKGQGMVPSHAKDQLTTAAAYTALCHRHDQDPAPDTLAALEARAWQQRVAILFRPGEIEEAGIELRDAAKLIRDLDAGVLTPIRNASRMHCQGCRFREICTEPGDHLLVESLFTRTEPKRLREKEESLA